MPCAGSRFGVYLARLQFCFDSVLLGGLSNPVLKTCFTCVCVHVCFHMHVGTYRGPKGLRIAWSRCDRQSVNHLTGCWKLNCGPL